MVKLDEANYNELISWSYKNQNASLVDKIKSLESELDMSRTILERLSSVKLGEVLDYDKPSFNKYGFGYILYIGLSSPSTSNSHTPKDEIVFVPLANRSEKKEIQST